MIKYTIGGKLKDDREQKEYCKTCRNGEIFKDEEFIKTQEFEEDVATRSCGVCLSKYYFEKKQAEKLISPACADCKFCDGQQCLNTKANFLCSGNVVKVIARLTSDALVEPSVGFLMNKKKYIDTGICSHGNVAEIPFETASEHTNIRICQVCGMAQYNECGEVLTGDVKDILFRIVDRSNDRFSEIKSALQGIDGATSKPLFKNISVNTLFDIGIGGQNGICD